MIRFEWPEFIQRFRERMSIRLLIIAVLVLAGGYAFYEGTKHAKQPEMVKKRVIQPTKLVADQTGQNGDSQTNLGQPSTVALDQTEEGNDLYPAGSASYSLSNQNPAPAYGAANSVYNTQTYGQADPPNGLRAASNEIAAVAGEFPVNEPAADAASLYAAPYGPAANGTPAAETTSAQPAMMAPPARGVLGRNSSSRGSLRTASVPPPPEDDFRMFMTGEPNWRAT